MWRYKAQRGFTLIEMVVVIVIIGILARIIIVNLAAQKLRARDATRIEDIHALQVKLHAYYSDRGSYPETLDGLVTAGYGALPKDPVTKNSYVYAALSPHLGDTQSCPDSIRPLKYHLGADLEGTYASEANLAKDVDWANPGDTYKKCGNSTSDFNGNAAGCALLPAPATAAANEDCYDVTN